MGTELEVRNLKLNTWNFLYRTHRFILPEVHRQLAHWKQRALLIPDKELHEQALTSIENKTFHCEGGSVYVADAFASRHILIPLIVAFQTISDYLDNLCDRSTSLNPEDFACLHESMLDAVSLQRPLRDYYAVRKQTGEPFEDGGYLSELVQACREQITVLPGYPLVEEQILEWVALYRDLQVHKHVHPAEREGRLLQWWKMHQSKYPELRWNEFAAATGSTLGVFSLFLLASRNRITPEQLDRHKRAYFPWIAASHILLDYLIDIEEDKIGGDLNFITYYKATDDALQRLRWIAKKTREEVDLLTDISSIHAIAVDGLFGSYLSDGKVRRLALTRQFSELLLREASWRSKLFYLYSRWYRGNDVQMQAPPKR